MSIIIVTVGLTLLAEEATRCIIHRIARALRHRRRLARLEANHHENGLAVIRTAQLPVEAAAIVTENK